MTSDEWLVVSDGVSVLIVLHEENMGHVEFPSLVLTAKFCRLSENFLNLGVISFIPINLGLHHKNWDVEIKGSIVLLESHSDGLGVSCNSCILDRFSFLPEGIDMVVGELFEFSMGFFLRGLVQNESF